MMWDILNKIATIGTILGIPATLGGIVTLAYKTIVVYDMYRETNEAGGYTLCIGSYTRSDRRRGKKENSNREYHRKGKDDNPVNWV